MLAYIGIDQPIKGLNWALPLGLSFYTFQALGYLWDVYYGRYRAEHNFLDYTLFVCFFPQILCGPINTAESLLPQIKNPAQFEYSRAVRGLKYILWGMFLKVVLADRIGIYVDTVLDNYEHYSGTSCLLSAILFSFQIYGDFAGYSFMALGVAKMLGFDIIKNFNRPYFATSVSEFWKRWNISLTKWLTRYVFIPLGGSRVGALKNYRNIIITFLVSGLWHGANYTFILWGLIHGLAQSIEKAIGWNKKTKFSVYEVLFRVLVTFTIVTVAWVIFRMPTIHSAIEVICKIFTNAGKLFVDNEVLAHIALALFILFPIEWLLEFRRLSFADFLKRHTLIRWIGYLGMSSIIILFGVLDSSQFIYVNF